MKSALLTFLALCSLSPACRAEVFIERFTQIATRTGQGEERILRFKGWVIRDLDGTNGAAIGTTTVDGHKVYVLDRSTTRVFRTTVAGANGRSFTVVARGETKTNELQVESVNALLFKGVNTTLQISTEREITYPRSLRGAVSTVEDTGSGYRLNESSITRIFSQSETRAANALGRDVDTVVAEIIQRLQQAGYVDAS